MVKIAINRAEVAKTVRGTQRRRFQTIKNKMSL